MMKRTFWFLMLVLLFSLFLAANASAGKPEEDKLRNAAENGDIVTVRSLLNQGVDVNSNAYGRTALLWAAQNKHMDIVRLLIEKGANVNTKDKNTGTPLIYEVINGQLDMVKLLLDKGADLNMVSGPVDATALIYAVFQNNKDAVQFLVKRGADVNVKDKLGMTALKYAVLAGNKEIGRILIENGAKEGKEEYMNLVKSYQEGYGVSDPRDLDKMWVKFRTFLAQGKIDSAQNLFLQLRERITVVI